ncbi:IMS domain-containing protein [Synechococcus sp. PCC 6716]|nr:IMS domain-containing protein [Synechococcus sp. PCC 6716]
MNIQELIEAYKSGQRNFADQDIACDISIYDEDLSHINLQNAKLIRAIFVGLNLSKANLAGATLNGAQLRYVDLTDADLRGTDFTKASFQDVDVKGAIYNQKTRFPRGFNPEQAGARIDQDEEEESGTDDTIISTDPADPQPTSLSPPEVTQTEELGPPQPPKGEDSSAGADSGQQRSFNFIAILFLLGLFAGLTVLSAFIAIAIVFSNLPNNTPEQVTNSDTSEPVARPEQVTNSDTSESVATPEPQPKYLSETEAMDILEAWFNAKPAIFGPSYNVDPAYQIITGKLLNTIVYESVPWLRNNRTYYVYNSYALKPQSFSSDNGVATIVVSVSEELSMYRNGEFVKDDSFYGKVYQYLIIYDDNSKSWKIANSKKL